MTLDPTGIEHVEYLGYWRPRADDRLDDPPTRCKQEPLMVKDKDERPHKGVSGNALASVYVDCCTVGLAEGSGHFCGTIG